MVLYEYGTGVARVWHGMVDSVQTRLPKSHRWGFLSCSKHKHQQISTPPLNSRDAERPDRSVHSPVVQNPHHPVPRFPRQNLRSPWWPAVEIFFDTPIKVILESTKKHHGLQNHQPKRPHRLLSEILVYHSTLSAHTGMTGSSHPFVFCLYVGVVLNKSSQEPSFRKSFASFRGPIRVAFSKIKNSYQESNIWNQTNTNTKYTTNWLLFARMNGSNQNVIVICCFFSLGPISGMAKCSPFWAGHGSSGYVFRASFARLSQTFRSKS